MLNFGAARADLGIAALPLLVEKGGRMLVDDWDAPKSKCVRETLLRFYDVDDLQHDLAVLRPKPASWLDSLTVYERERTGGAGGAVERARGAVSTASASERGGCLCCSRAGGGGLRCSRTNVCAARTLLPLHCPLC